MEVDWSHGEAHMWARHRVTVDEANEALTDPDGLLFFPDPKSRSGKSARLVGYSPSARSVLTVILVRRDGGPDRWWGANGWRSNTADRREYKEGTAT